MDTLGSVARPERENHEYIPEQVRLSAYQSWEEALTNSVKHSQARHVSVRVEVSESETLRDHTKLAGGALTVQSEVGLGTTIQAELPLFASQVASRSV